jgi:hypothetical protein
VNVKQLFWDALAVAGLASVGYGLWAIYPPLAWIVLGAFALALGLWGAKLWAS